MYCPHCGVHNEPKQGYCRQCGQSFGSVQLALDGRVDEVRSKFYKAENLLACGLLSFLIFFLTGVISLFFGGTFLFSINVILGFVICLPMVLIGLRRVDRLRKVLDSGEKTGDRLLEQSSRSAAALPEARATDPLTSGTPSSVTEHTTLTLRVPK
jgi:hypothetical protein